MPRIGFTKRHIGDHRLAEFFVGFGVELGVAFEFAARFAVIVLAPEIIAVGHRRDRAVERENFQAVAREVEVANDFWAKQRDDVRENRKFEAGDDFFGDGCAAENVTAFSRTRTFFPALARYAAFTRPLWPPPITMTSYFFAMNFRAKMRREGCSPRPKDSTGVGRTVTRKKRRGSLTASQGPLRV